MSFIKIPTAVHLIRNAQVGRSLVAGRLGAIAGSARGPYPSAATPAFGCSPRGHVRSLSGAAPEAGIHRSPFRDVTLPDNTPLTHHVMEDFGRFGDKVALVRIKSRMINMDKLK